MIANRVPARRDEKRPQECARLPLRLVTSAAGMPLIRRGNNAERAAEPTYIAGSGCAPPFRGAIRRCRRTPNTVKARTSAAMAAEM